jgi:hypothetical protein
MGFIAKDSGGGNFKPVPPGAYVARCYQIVDLGTQTSSGQYGEKSAHKLRLSWELFGEDEDGQPLTVSYDGKTMPMTVSKSYTVSMHEKASLRKDLAAWRGRDFTTEEQRAFDVSKLLGAYALINVNNSTGGNGKTYANVAGLSPLPKPLAATKPAGVHALTQFDLDNPDMGVFDALPAYLQDQIRTAPEWGRKTQFAPALAEMDDDIPF